MRAFQHEHRVLVVDRRLHAHDARRSLPLQRRDLQQRIKRVARIGRLQEFRAHLDEPDQVIPDHMRKQPRPRRRQRQQMKPMRQQILVPRRLAVRPIIMDRMIVAGEKLERREMRIGERPRRTRIPLADFKLIEPTLGHERAGERIEGLGHFFPELDSWSLGKVGYRRSRGIA